MKKVSLISCVFIALGIISMSSASAADLVFSTSSSVAVQRCSPKYPNSPEVTRGIERAAWKDRCSQQCNGQSHLILTINSYGMTTGNSSCYQGYEVYDILCFCEPVWSGGSGNLGLPFPSLGALVS